MPLPPSPLPKWLRRYKRQNAIRRCGAKFFWCIANLHHLLCLAGWHSFLTFSQHTTQQQQQSHRIVKPGKIFILWHDRQIFSGKKINNSFIFGSSSNLSLMGEKIQQSGKKTWSLVAICSSGKIWWQCSEDEHIQAHFSLAFAATDHILSKVQSPLMNQKPLQRNDMELLHTSPELQFLKC